MICPQCKSQINDDAKFCNVCGTKLVQNLNQTEEPVAVVQETETQQVIQESAQPSYQPQPEQPVQPSYQPQPEQPVQPSYQPQIEQPVYRDYQPQGFQQPQQNNDRFTQQFQEFQQSNQQFKNPQYMNQGNQYGHQGGYVQHYDGNMGTQTMNPMIQPAQPKKSKAPIIIAIAAGAATVVAVVVVLIVIFMGRVSSNNIVNDFVTAIQKNDVSYIEKYAFEEEKSDIDLSDFLGGLTTGVTIEGTTKGVESYKSGVNFDRFAQAVADEYPSVGGVGNISERQIVTGQFSVSLLGFSQDMTMYFDMACVGGQWKCVDAETSRSSLNYLD